MSDLLKAAKKALPGLDWDGDSNEVGADIPEVGVATIWRAPSSTQAQLSMFTASTIPMPPVDASAWLRAQVVARRDALDAALGQGWISVSERLPALDVTVIIATPDGDTQVAERSMNGDEWLWATLDNGSMLFYDVQPTHWRPLPAAPEVKP